MLAHEEDIAMWSIDSLRAKAEAGEADATSGLGTDYWAARCGLVVIWGSPGERNGQGFDDEVAARRHYDLTVRRLETRQPTGTPTAPVARGGVDTDAEVDADAA